MRRLSIFISIFMTTIILLTLGQACQQSTKFTSTDTLSSFKNSLSGNGGTYDGKIRVLHHYVDDFTCEGKPRPESILMRDQSLQWTLIRNTPEKCAFINRVAVTNVDYNEVQNQALYNGDIYVPPRDFLVSATEDPNLPGVNLDTGVCEDANGICSLHAAMDQAALTSLTAPVVIHLPSGLYKITSSIQLVSTFLSAKSVTVRGADPTTTVLDGSFSVAPLSINRRSADPVVIENLTLQNGSATVGSFEGAAINFQFFNYSPVDITNCIIKNNKNNVAVYSANSKAVHIRKTIFSGNDEAAVRVFGTTTLIEDSIFDSNPNTGLWVSVQTVGVVVKRSTFSNNGNAISVYDCYGCSLENVTVANNQSGISIYTDRAEVGSDFTITNSTFVNNNSPTSGNLDLHFYDSTNRLFFNNSILANNDQSKANCLWRFPNDSLTLKATNSLIDDTSCGAQDSTNIIAPAQLGPLTSNGGFTETMAPQTGSPLINAGSDLLCAATDQRGKPRIQCDIGAVELP